MIELQDRVEDLENVLAEHIRRSDRILAALAESNAAIRESIAEIRASNARTDHQLLILQQQAEKDRQQADKDRQQAEKDRQQAEKDRQQADKDRKAFNRRLAEITDSQGLMIENMVAPNLKRIAMEIFGGVPAEFEAIRLQRRKPGDAGRHKEIDLMAAAPSPGPILVCEAKSKPSAEKVREFVSSLEDFTDFFPEYFGRPLIPMVASMWFDASLVQFMTNQGVVALGFGDETMEILNPEAIRH